MLVGAALGVSGAVMQAVTRNPLADPGVLGVNAGASFAVVLAIWAFDVSNVLGLVWFAFLGAALVSVVVYALGSVGRGGATPVRLALSGAALSSLLFALTRAVTLLDEATLDQFRFWAVGSLSGRDSSVVTSVVWFIVVGLALAALLTRPLNAIGLGDDAAAGLGIKVGLTRAVAGLTIVLLCGAAVAAVGPHTQCPGGDVPERRCRLSRRHRRCRDGADFDVDHVAFASDRKYDGYQFRRLNPSEFAQIVAVWAAPRAMVLSAPPGAARRSSRNW